MTTPPTQTAPRRALAAWGSPLLRLVSDSFKTMRSTHYQHHTAVDPATGSYRFDCVGLVSWALREAAPQAWQSLVQRMAIRPGHIPSPPTLALFLTGLPRQPAAGWHAVERVQELQAGDVLSWEHRSSHASGHAAILAATPRPLSADLWQVEVFDATSTPHQDDSRPSDRRAEIFERTGRPSGLGRGVMALAVNPSDGRLLGFRWRPQGPTVEAPIAAGRPLF